MWQNVFPTDVFAAPWPNLQAVSSFSTVSLESSVAVDVSLFGACLWLLVNEYILVASTMYKKER